MRVFQVLVIVLCLVALLSCVSGTKKHHHKRHHRKHRIHKTTPPPSSSSSSSSYSDEDLSQLSASARERVEFLKKLDEWHDTHNAGDVMEFGLSTEMGKLANKYFNDVEKQLDAKEKKALKH